MNKMKNISFVWGIVVVLLVGLLTTLGFIYKNKSQKYKKLEKELVEIAKIYTATDFNFPVNGQEIVITFDELKKTELIEKLEVEKKQCEGYVVMSFNNVTDYKAYINCDKYKTHGYDKNKLDK